MSELDDLVPDHYKFYEKDNSICVATQIKEAPLSDYLLWRGTEAQIQHQDRPRFSRDRGTGELVRRASGIPIQLRRSEYFFDESGLAVGFKRSNIAAHLADFQTIYPHRELNVYYRWEVGFDYNKEHWVAIKGGNPQIWFGRMFVDHGSARQLEEMKQSLGSVSFNDGHLKSINMGRVFLNDRSLKDYMSLGQPILDIPSNANRIEDFRFYLAEQALGGGKDLATVEQVGDTLYLVTSPDGQPAYTISWWEKNRALFIAQEQLPTKIRKTVRTKYNFNVGLAVNLAAAEIDPNQSQERAMEQWIAMAAEVGCHFSIGGGLIGRLFEE